VSLRTIYPKGVLATVSGKVTKCHFARLIEDFSSLRRKGPMSGQATVRRV